MAMAASKPDGAVHAQPAFSLATAKSEVTKELHSILPAAIRKYMNSPNYDQIVKTCILYFIAKFQSEFLQKALERAKRQRLDGYDPVAVELKLRDLDAEAAALKASLSPLYAMIIMRHSSYKHVNRDRLFFEGFYITLINICDEAFLHLNKRSDIEMELGLIFRSRHFNLYQRINAAPRSVDTLSVKEVYAMKHETSNRALNAKLLSALVARPTSLNMQAAAVNNSPLISEFISSVITARAITKDPELRKQKLGATMARDRSPKSKRSPSLASLASPKAAPGPDGMQRLRPPPLNVVHGAPDGLEAPTPSAFPPSVLPGKLPFGPPTLTTSSGSPSLPTFGGDGEQLGTVTDRHFMSPGFEHVGHLYDEKIAALDDLKYYIHMGRYPKDEIAAMNAANSNLESAQLTQTMSVAHTRTQPAVAASSTE